MSMFKLYAIISQSMGFKTHIVLFVLLLLDTSLYPGSTSSVHVRLVDTTVPNAGRVEIGYKGVWKSICDTNWYFSVANVACRMLGYNQGAAAAIHGMASSDDPWLLSFFCEDHKTSIDSIDKCTISNSTTCPNDRKAGVVCITDEITTPGCTISSAPSVAVRLVNGSTPNRGRVEVRYYGVWGTVCDDGWDLADAHVVCRMLNYSKASWVGTANVSGIALVFLNDLSCHGSEASVENCPYVAWGSDHCVTKKHAAVMCDNKTDAPVVSVRLVRGQNHTGGVEVSYNGTWIPVCDENWDILDAHVLCRMLNYNGALVAFKRFSVGQAGVWMSNVACSGKEKSISECYHLGWSNEQCSGRHYAGVLCQKSEAQFPNVAVRLVNGSTPNEGRVEVRYYVVWGTVCNKMWDLADAHVVCHMLNYSKASWARTAKFSGSGLILIDKVDCRGNEKSLADCPKSGWGQHDCGHSEDAGVKCENLTQEELSVAVRLGGSDQNNTGFVELKYNGTWIPVCDDTWDILDAHVVCRMLGYKAALAVIKRSIAWKTEPVWMGGVECRGDEILIGECYHRGWTNKHCYGNSYAGVMCKSNSNKDLSPVQVRLEDGSTHNSGRVAIHYGNFWSTIFNSGLDINAAKVICGMLGYPGASKLYSLQRSSFEFRPIWLSNLECNGTEKSISDCRFQGWGNATCNYDIDAAITCKHPDVPQFQINGSDSITESTVVILFNDSWTTDGQVKRLYQVAVEKRDTKPNFKSYQQTLVFVYNEVNVTMATQIGNDSYITAEVISPIKNLTIGDGQYYHGYYNAPLEHGSMYRVHMRIVTMATDGNNKIHGESSFVEFTTKSLLSQQGKSVTTDTDTYQIVLIGLAVACLFLLCVAIVLYLYTRHASMSKKIYNPKNEMIEIPRAKRVILHQTSSQFNKQHDSCPDTTI